MELFTRRKIMDMANNKVPIYKTKSGIITDARNEARENSLAPTIFLSHSHKDAKLVEDIVVILKGLGITVYVDWMDDDMPSTTCAETAKKIKQKIIENKKFIFLATDNALASKWCNWEIGYADTHKLPNNNMAIWAVTDDNGNWTGNEFLQLYPSVRFDPKTNIISVLPPGRKYTGDVGIRDWLKR